MKQRSVNPTTKPSQHLLPSSQDADQATPVDSVLARSVSHRTEAKQTKDTNCPIENRATRQSIHHKHHRRIA
jgi:hypothetical protein